MKALQEEAPYQPSGSGSLLLPVRHSAIVFVDLQGKLAVVWARPVVLVKSRSLFKQFLVHIEDELLVMVRELQGVPGNGNRLSPKPMKPPKESTA